MGHSILPPSVRRGELRGALPARRGLRGGFPCGEMGTGWGPLALALQEAEEQQHRHPARGAATPKTHFPAPSLNFAVRNTGTARCLGSCSCRQEVFGPGCHHLGAAASLLLHGHGHAGPGREGARATLPCDSSREGGGKSPETGLAFQMLIINSSSLSSESPS